MTIDPSIVGYSTDEFFHTLEQRWSMAYAASLKDMSKEYFDDVSYQPVLVHPLFPVCLEWPTLVDCFKKHKMSMQNMVHATHDLHIFNPLTPGETYRTTAHIIGVEQKMPGIFLSWRIDTLDSRNKVVATTWQGNIFLGASLSVPDRILEPLPEIPIPYATESQVKEQVPIEACSELAHTYTECARIWNPIHTEKSVANESGMTKPLLHGTASLGLAVSKITQLLLDDKTNRISRLGCRFSSPVTLPQELNLNIISTADETIHFELISKNGQKVLDRGFLCLSRLKS